MMFSEFEEVRGNSSRPVAVLNAAGDSVLLMPKPTTARLSYIGRLEAVGEGTESVEIEETIYRAVVCKTAALVMSGYKAADAMQLLNALCMEQLGAMPQ